MKTENTFQQRLDVIDQLVETVGNILPDKNKPADVFDADFLQNRLEYRSGTILWGFAYPFPSTTEGMRLSQKPVKGILLTYKDEQHYKEFLEHPNDSMFQGTPAYFIPFSQKTPDKLLFSQAVRIDKRKYARTEEAAWDGYYEEVMKVIETGTGKGYIKEILDDLHGQEKL